MNVEPFWTEINETTLRQGDYLPQCLVPEFGPDFAAAGTHEVTAKGVSFFDPKRFLTRMALT